MTRHHAIYDKRHDQLYLNYLAARGGHDYIDARLVRAPNESDLSWYGHSISGQNAVGRLHRAALVNDAYRVQQKINQYIFADEPQREGIDELFEQNVDNMGTSIREFFMGVSDNLTESGWLWVNVDRAKAEFDAEGHLIERTLAQKEQINDRIRWNIYPALSVVDWNIGNDGRLNWILTEKEVYDNSDPFKAPTTIMVRKLWQYDSNGAVWQTYTKGKRNNVLLNEGRIQTPEVPFVLIGKPTMDEWWFSDVENIQSQLLNLDSLHVENLVRTVFPQLVISDEMLKSLEIKMVEQVGNDNQHRVAQLVRELVRGLDSPFVESSDTANITRFIQPNASDLLALPNEIKRKRSLMFENVGLSLFNRESRAIQTAESKRFDHLDTNATLKNRSLALQEAEYKLIDLSIKMDSTFKSYEPVWPMDFSVDDPQQDAELMDKIDEESLTPEQQELLEKAKTKILEEASQGFSE